MGMECVQTADGKLFSVKVSCVLQIIQSNIFIYYVAQMEGVL